MYILFFLIIVLAVFIPFLSWFTGKYAEFWIKKLVTEKTDAIYEILQTSEAPLSWRVPFINKIAGGRLQQKINIMKIHSLKRYIKQSPLFSVDKQNEIILGLEVVMKEWEEAI